MLSAAAGCNGDEAGERGCVLWLDTEWRAAAMAGVFDIDLDQPDENVSDDELEDGVSLR